LAGIHAIDLVNVHSPSEAMVSEMVAKFSSVAVILKFVMMPAPA
jgi:hypothetical protein